jgi:colicin import membrane protein
MARSQSSAARRTKAEDPYRIGCRYVKRGRIYETVPLTEEDLLYPQEGDQIVQNDFHASDFLYLLSVFREKAKTKPGVRILGDHRIDFQVPGLQPLGPDITVLDGEPLEWDRDKGTFPVVDMKSRPLFVIELTSPTTRRKDVNEKVGLYYRAGVPLYILVDAPYGGSKKPLGIVPYQAGPNKYELLPVDANNRFTLGIFDLSLGIEDGHVVCFDIQGAPIGDYSHFVAEAEREKARADEEKARADEEKARADEEKARADAAESRADAAEARIQELEALLKNPPKRPKK